MVNTCLMSFAVGRKKLIQAGFSCFKSPKCVSIASYTLFKWVIFLKPESLNCYGSRLGFCAFNSCVTVTNSTDHILFYCAFPLHPFLEDHISATRDFGWQEPSPDLFLYFCFPS